MAAASGQVEMVERSADAAERAFAGAAEEPFEPTVGNAASLLANVPAHIALDRSYVAQLRGDAESTAAFASQALAELSEGEWMVRSIAQGLLAVAEWLRAGSRRPSAPSCPASPGGGRGQPTVTAWGGYQLGQVQRAQGRLDAAARTYQQALETTAVTGRPALPAAGPAYVGLGEVAYQRNELDIALRHVTEGIALCGQFVYTPPLAAGLVTLAWIRQATGDPAGALAAIAEAGRASPGRPARSTLCRPSGRGCCWPRTTWPGPCSGPRRAASARTTSLTTLASRDTWCWPGFCLPGTFPVRHSRC